MIFDRLETFRGTSETWMHMILMAVNLVNVLLAVTSNVKRH